MALLPHSATLATWLCCAALTAQIQPGRFVLPSADPNAPLQVVEPLRASVRTVRDPLALLPAPPSAVVASPFSAGAWVAALTSPTAGSSRLVEFTVVLDRITALRTLSSATPEAVRSLDVLGDGTVAVLTPSTVYTLAANRLSPALTAGSAEAFVDLHATDSGIVALATNSATGAATLRLVVPGSGTRIRRIPIRNASRVAPDPGRQGYLIGDVFGNLWFVDDARFVAQILVGSPRGLPVTALCWNPDRGHHLIAAGPEAFLFDSRVLSTPIPLPGPVTGPARYLPYASRVRSFGRPCSASDGTTPTSSWSGSPQPGSTDFVIRLGTAPPATTAWLLLGLQARNLPLDPLGLTGCQSLLDPLDALPSRAGALGTAVQRLPIPGDPGLIGARLFSQWLVLAPAANRGGALTSDALDILF